jgi:hypothetical protein
MARHRRFKRDMDERFSLPEDTDPDEVLRRLLGVKTPPVDPTDSEDKTEPDS